MQSFALDLSFKLIPETFNAYYINERKNVYRTNTHEQLEPDADGFITLDTVMGTKRVKLALLIALTFKKSRILSHLWEFLDVGCVDKTGDLLDPANLVIMFPDGGLEHPGYNGFCYIPAFTRYVINEEGEIFDTEKLAVVRIDTYPVYTTTASMAGYRYCTLITDIGKRTTVGLHRALCLAFKKFPVNVDKLDVNHEDGIKGNNDLSNLTWSSRRRNNLHATELGNRPDNHPVVMKSIFTGEERTYFSLTECGRALGTHQENIRFRVNHDGQRAFRPGLLFKRQSSKAPWLTIADPDSLLHGKGTSIEYDCLDTKTGKVECFKTGKALQKFLEIDEEQFASLCHSGDFKLGQYVVSKADYRKKCGSLFAEKQKSYLL